MSLSSLFDERLPINRKEVYYTATVLPCIVCADGFAHIHRLWKLLGIEVPQVNATPTSANIQFLTEYNSRQSIYGKLDRERFSQEVESGETPDIVILIDGPSPLIVSIEAKMYDTVNVGEMLNQLRLQRENVLQPLLSGIPKGRFEQIALLPEGMGITAEALYPTKLLHWEQIVNEFADVASSAYFRAVLEVALKYYRRLQNKKRVFREHMEALMNGAEILRRYDHGTLEFQTMGRRGGINGTELAEDITSGHWRKHRYELRREQTPINTNWFAIADFVARVRHINRAN